MLLSKNISSVSFKICMLFCVFALLCPAVHAQEENEEYTEDDEYIEDTYVDDSQVDNSISEFFTAVKDFDISGFRIGMNYKQAIKTAKEMKFTVDKIINETPEYLKYNFDILCQKQKIFQVDALAACVDGYAKKSKMNYVKKIELTKPSTGEKMNIFFTSAITENMVYRIEYKIDLMGLEGDQKKFLYRREENRRAYWYSIIEKYGPPNIEPHTWIYNPEDPMSTRMIANFEGILMENDGMREIDFIEGVKKARTTFLPIEFSF